MSRYVLKFGGTSIADIDRIRKIAALVKEEYSKNHEIAIVVSAMAGTTNELVSWAAEISSNYDRKEYDVVVSAGEQITAGLLSLAIQNLSIPVRSWLGWQLKINTNDSHGSARIESIDTAELESSLALGNVAVIAGFQGLAFNDRISTLGRGGSDTTAVAIAAALKAERCDIYTDVDGVYTTDPRIVAKARKLDKITYEEMLEMASLGAKVLQTRSVELAMNHNVRLQVLSSFNKKPGTLVVSEEEIVEKEIVSGITYSPNEAKITIREVADRPGIAAAVFGPLAVAEINVDMIVQNISSEKKSTDITFTISRNQIAEALDVLNKNQKSLGFREIIANEKVVKISVIGVGMRSHVGVAQKMFSTLAEKGINIHVISTSEIKVSVLIDEEYTELAIRSLHSAYDLDEK
tara:strand:+ start:4847 stop:6067 length:1221 start_codon:yes stop_codon:yes gene_type:complete